MAKRGSIKTKSSVPNIDPFFFFSTSRQNSIRTEDIERHPYQWHWLIYSCASVISRNLRSVERVLFDKASKDTLEEHEALEVLNNPNPYLSGEQFWEAIVLHLLLPTSTMGYWRAEAGGGQAFIVCQDKNGKPVDLRAGEIPALMWPYGDENVTPTFLDPQTRNQFIGWTLKVGDGPDAVREFYEPHQIIRIALFNPYNWFRGIAPSMPASLAMYKDLKAEVWNTRNFENDAVPSGILASDEMIDQKQADEIKARWYSAHGGPGNQRRIAVLGKSMKFQEVSWKPSDIEFTKQQDVVRKTFLGVFGLNEIAVGNYEQINYATIVEGRRMLWEDTYLPLDRTICKAFSTQWTHAIGMPRKKWWLQGDYSNVPALRRDVEKASQNIQRFVQCGAPFALAAELADFPLPDDAVEMWPSLNEPLKQQAPQPYGQPQNQGKEDEDEKKKEQQGKNIRIIRAARDKISDAYIERVLDPGEKHFQRLLVRFFTRERNEMQDAVDAYFAPLLKAVRSVLPDINAEQFLLNLDDETKKLTGDYKIIVEDQLKRERAKLMEELGADAITWNVSPPMIEQYARARASELREINGTTNEYVIDHVNKAVAEAIDKQKTVGELRQSIKDALADVGEIRKNHALTIARTETAIVSAEARYDSFKSTGIQQWQWLSAGDEAVRASHVAENGQIVNVGDVFPHTQLHYPSEAGGAPEEVINCRCACFASEEID